MSIRINDSCFPTDLALLTAKWHTDVGCPAFMAGAPSHGDLERNPG